MLIANSYFSVCPQHYSQGLLWEQLDTNQLSRIYCASWHPSFNSEGFITRFCNANRQWSDVDFSSCTMKSDAKLLIMTEIRGNVTMVMSAQSIVNNVSVT